MIPPFWGVWRWRLPSRWWDVQALNKSRCGELINFGVSPTTSRRRSQSVSRLRDLGPSWMVKEGALELRWRDFWSVSAWGFGSWARGRPLGSPFRFLQVKRFTACSSGALYSPFMMKFGASLLGHPITLCWLRSSALKLRSVCVCPLWGSQIGGRLLTLMPWPLMHRKKVEVSVWPSGWLPEDDRPFALESSAENGLALALFTSCQQGPGRPLWGTRPITLRSWTGNSSRRPRSQRKRTSGKLQLATAFTLPRLLSFWEQSCFTWGCFANAKGPMNCLHLCWRGIGAGQCGGNWWSSQILRNHCITTSAPQKDLDEESLNEHLMSRLVHIFWVFL